MATKPLTDEDKELLASIPAEALQFSPESGFSVNISISDSINLQALPRVTLIKDEIYYQIGNDIQRELARLHPDMVIDGLARIPDGFNCVDDLFNTTHFTVSADNNVSFKSNLAIADYNPTITKLHRALFEGINDIDSYKDNIEFVNKDYNIEQVFNISDESELGKKIVNLLEQRVKDIVSRVQPTIGLGYDEGANFRIDENGNLCVRSSVISVASIDQSSQAVPELCKFKSAVNQLVTYTQNKEGWAPDEFTFYPAAFEAERLEELENDLMATLNSGDAKFSKHLDGKVKLVIDKDDVERIAKFLKNIGSERASIEGQYLVLHDPKLIEQYSPNLSKQEQPVVDNYSDIQQPSVDVNVTASDFPDSIANRFARKDTLPQGLIIAAKEKDKDADLTGAKIVSRDNKCYLDLSGCKGLLDARGRYGEVNGLNNFTLDVLNAFKSLDIKGISRTEAGDLQISEEAIKTIQDRFPRTFGDDVVGVNAAKNGIVGFVARALQSKSKDDSQQGVGL